MIDYKKPIQTKSGDAAELITNIRMTGAPYVVHTVLGVFFYTANGCRRADHGKPTIDMRLENV